MLFRCEDAVVENLFIVLQAHCDRLAMNVKLVVKYCNECYD